MLSQSHQLEHPTHRARRTKSIPSNLNKVYRNNIKKRQGQRLRKPAATLYDQLLEQTEAQWFLNLPEKVRRQQFSREEQILFANRCDSLGQGVSDEIPTLPPLPQQEDLRPPTPTRPKSLSSLATTAVEYSPLPIERTDPIEDTRPDDMASCFDPSKKSRRGSLSKRTLSMTGITNARLSTSSMPPLLPSPFPNHGGSSHKRTTSAAPRASESSIAAFDPNAVHYQDPEARMKLRTYLGSAQKFDEAIEFGFPSNRESLPPQPADDRDRFLAPLTLSHDFQSFLNDGWLSFLDSEEELEDDDEADNDSLPDADSPVTPGDANVAFRQSDEDDLSPRSSTDSTARPSSSNKQQPDPFSRHLSGGREMTLRMTLTRPDLRANEEELYGWQPPRTRDDPLALEELPVSDDVNGGQSPFNVKQNRNSGRMKRLLSFVKKERR